MKGMEQGAIFDISKAKPRWYNMTQSHDITYVFWHKQGPPTTNGYFTASTCYENSFIKLGKEDGYLVFWLFSF